jgi:ABC-type multidrug transport system fused ATPase/permease subunit
MIALGWVWTWLQAPIAGMRRVHSVLDHLPYDSVPSRSGQLAERIREIEFSNVSVGYAAHAPVLEQIRLRVVAGEVVGIAGPSGAGKSTLVNCIPRFIEPSAREILINGIDVRIFSTAALRKRIALVFQEEALFSATIADNISYGSPNASATAIRRAAEMAEAGSSSSGCRNGT